MIPAHHLVSGLTLLTLLVAGCGQSPLVANQATSRTAQARALAVKAKAAPTDYYAPVANASGRALLEGLNRIVGPHKDLGYDMARDVMFATVDDLDNDDVVGCIYIGRELERVTNRGTAFRNGAGLNAEHTWPQSKGAEGVAKADLNHLFPADCKANSTRGSHPFGEVVNVEWSQGGSALGTDAKGNLVFSPRPEQRGNTARALLYFYTVYGLNQKLDTSNFRIEEPVLKKWHAEDPVTAADVARNDAVFGAQGNRNPFVDHPEFVAKAGTFLSNSR